MGPGMMEPHKRLSAFLDEENVRMPHRGGDV